jgi:transposase
VYTGVAWRREGLSERAAAKKVGKARETFRRWVKPLLAGEDLPPTQRANREPPPKPKRVEWRPPPLRADPSWIDVVELQRQRERVSSESRRRRRRARTERMIRRVRAIFRKRGK